ncbi:MAG: hypothetical protein ABIH56_04375 [Candidatus Margulisiibacteriota bacterium]
MNKENFYPLTYLREAEALRCGALTLREHPEINHPWELISGLKGALEKDLKVIGTKIKGLAHPTAVLYAPENILIEEGAQIEALAVLDARSGPIYIGANTVVRPQSYLRGPLYIGPECRIGGEVTHSIFHGYSNKAHYGFIGHSYIGEWVNLGAGTTNSNLKNTYGTVKMTINGETLDSGERFLGCLIGDHAKLGIGSLIPTGAVIGLGANVFGGGMIAKCVPNFAWGEKGRVDLEKFLAGVKLVMARRGQVLTPELAELLVTNFRRQSGV